MTTWTGTVPSIAVGAEVLGADSEAFADAIAALSDSWTTYTPVWSGSSSNPSLVNGTISGWYLRVRHFIAVRILLTAGSSTTFGSGAYSFSLPVAPLNNQMIPCIFKDSSASLRWAGAAEIIAASATGDNMRIALLAGGTNFGPTSPVTMATSDTFILEGIYES